MYIRVQNVPIFAKHVGNLSQRHAKHKPGKYFPINHAIANFMHEQNYVVVYHIACMDIFLDAIRYYPTESVSIFHICLQMLMCLN